MGSGVGLCLIRQVVCAADDKAREAGMPKHYGTKKSLTESKMLDSELFTLPDLGFALI